MYSDDPPVANYRTRQVVVVEEDDFDADEILDLARAIDAVTDDGDDGEIFHVVFWHEPRRVWDLTEAALRSDIQRRRQR